MNINESIICAGFGGQGIMLLGKVLASAGMARGLHVTWMPSYGAEVRGGTAHCMVRIDSEQVATPIVSRTNTAIIMNGPSLDKFEPKVISRGLLILNTSLTDRRPGRDDIDVIEAPLTDEAIKLGNVRVANMIAAGVFTSKKQMFNKDMMVEVVKQIGKGYEELISVNIKALERGIEIGGAR